MVMVIKFDTSTGRTMAITDTGQIVELGMGTLFKTDEEALVVALKYGGKIEDEDYLFPDTCFDD